MITILPNGRILYDYNLYKSVYDELKEAREAGKTMPDGRFLLAKELEAILHIPDKERYAA